MAQYTNFYETIPESNIRLRGTVILYDGAPYTVLAICDHKKDGVFRIYMEPFGDPNCVSVFDRSVTINNNLMNPFFEYGYDNPDLGLYIDNFMQVLESDPSKFGKIHLVRKMMNSPLFNKFRPFPLGLCQTRNNRLIYIERSPTRRTEQGLVDRMLMPFEVNLNNNGEYARTPEFWGQECFRNTIMGQYPSKETAFALVQNGVSNTSCAFSREFAFFVGPAGAIFLVYKSNVVGVLLDNSFRNVRLDKQFSYLRETVEEAKLFETVLV